MQPPLPLGTILQNHYRLIKILGQGGFGRTYLAEDQARFNELCVLKEFTPRSNEDYLLHKSKELFQREAEVLYKIEHRQIPQFRSTFEQGKRLFLVQDYVEGKNYSTLLRERQQEGRAFSESEIVQFLQQMLPVLVHIHEKGIIHRDISPENIILRESDRLPVLIDFGAVKEKAAQLDSAGEIPPATTVGKLGYAPPEQLQTGEVFPNSDLYALAVTAVVLMTGRKPQELLEQSSMTWRWQLLPPIISLGIFNLLKKMMAPRPHNRYQSAIEVSQALRAWGGITTAASVIANKKSPHIKPTASRPTTRPYSAIGSSLSNLPFVGAGIGLLIILGFFLAIGSMIPTKSLKTATPAVSTATPTPTPTPIDAATTPEPTPSVTPTPTPEPVSTSETIGLITGLITYKEGNLKPNQTITYIISAQPGQQLSVSVTRGNISMNVLAPNRVPIDFQAKQVQRWEGLLPLAGDYYIELSPPTGVADSDYKLDIILTNPVEPTPSVSISPTTPESNLTPSPSPTSTGETLPIPTPSETP
ncbi:serine/threonine-protein kinase, partial [Planktothrix sp. FACHB-1355]